MSSYMHIGMDIKIPLVNIDLWDRDDNKFSKQDIKKFILQIPTKMYCWRAFCYV